MRKYYSQPEINIRPYSSVQGIVLTIDTSDPEGSGSNTDNGLDNDDEYDIFG